MAVQNPSVRLVHRRDSLQTRAVTNGIIVMKAVQFESTGEPSEVLRCAERPVPIPAHGEVLVRMLASPINPSDLMFIRGRYTTPAAPPATPGFEGVGMVEQSGGGLRGMLFKGKRVIVLNRREIGRAHV